MFTKLVRVGRSAELRMTAAGKPVIGLACVYDIGWGDNKKGQWIDVSIWGKQAEALAPFLLKGKQIVIYAEDVELETYQKNDGTSGSKLKCRAVNVELTSGGQHPTPQQQRPQQPAPQQPQYNKAHPAPPAGYQNQTGTPPPQQQGATSDFNNSFDDDIPFNNAQQSGQ